MKTEKLNKYRVIWCIDVWSDTPKQAAEFARELKSEALNFEVVDMATNEHTVLNLGESDVV